MYFSDIYADRPIPQELQDDKVLWGECLSGALAWGDFKSLIASMGFTEIRRIYSRPVELNDNMKIQEQVGDIKFASMTVRIFKSTGLTKKNLDYGETATYKGGIPDKEEGLVFDEHYYFPKGEAISVCSNTAQILRTSRFGKYFDISAKGELIGDHPIQVGTGEFFVGADASKEGEKEQLSTNCCGPSAPNEESKGCCPE